MRTRQFAGNDFWEYLIDDFVIDGEREGTYHYVHTLGSTMIVPVTDDGRLLLVRQYRYLNERFSLEFPCGGVQRGLSLEENAMKELREETGYSAGLLAKIGAFTPYTGAADEVCTLYLAQNLAHAPLTPDFTEDFSLHTLSLSEFQELISSNEIWDGLTLAAWALAKTKLEQILS